MGEMGKGRERERMSSDEIAVRASRDVSVQNEGRPPQQVQAGPADVQIVQAVQINATVRHVCTSGCVTAVAYFLYKSVEAIAGKTTAFKWILELAFQINAFGWFGWILAAVLTYAYRNSEGQRRRLIAEYTPKRKRLEVLLDQKRSSSGLDRYGDTPEDDLT
ncbi:MAG: hypothetical protein HY816_20185 [Candidatus Wallbacteria bacterium]|nr:hypothetical protein [Candidatus Wallbacteria bacterium]